MRTIGEQLCDLGKTRLVPVCIQAFFLSFHTFRTCSGIMDVLRHQKDHVCLSRQTWSFIPDRRPERGQERLYALGLGLRRFFRPLPCSSFGSSAGADLLLA